MKLKELRYFLGSRPPAKTYPHVVRSFELPKDGTVQYAQWLHPSETEKRITQRSVDELRKFVAPGDVAIDIGAHTGDSTLPIALAAGRSGCVLALEPNPYVYKVLETNSHLNPAKTHIVPLMFAATPDDAEMEFHYSDSGYCNGGRFDGISKWLHGHAFKLPVQGRNLQKFVETSYPGLLAKIRFIKIDTEGYEDVVVGSLGNLISGCRPFMKLEVYRKLNDEQRRALYRSVAAHSYSVWKIAHDGNYRGELITENDLSKWRHFDIFCEPR